MGDDVQGATMGDDVQGATVGDDVSVILAVEEVTLAGGIGSVTASTTNAAAEPRRLVLGVFAAVEGPSAVRAETWATVERPLREVPAGLTEQYLISFAAEPGTPPGAYAVRVIAYPADAAPEEYADRGRPLRLVVPAVQPVLPVRRPVPWWVFAAVAGVLVIAAAVVWWLTRDESTPAPVASATPTATPTPTAPVSRPVSAGTATIPGTWSFDLDTGQLGSAAGSDLWWRQVDSVTRFWTPTGGRFAVLDGRDFSGVTLQDLHSAAAGFSGDPVDGSDTGSNRLTPGTVLGYETDEGRLGALVIESYGYDLGVRWVTYE